jgi:phage terminase Nu1 subunit (DNA packaging protein)
MNTALNREASEARVADMRRRAGRDAIVLAAIRAANLESASLRASMIAAMLRLLQPRRIRRTLPRVIAADIDSLGTGSRRAAEEVTERK